MNVRSIKKKKRIR